MSPTHRPYIHKSHNPSESHALRAARLIDFLDQFTRLEEREIYQERMHVSAAMIQGGFQTPYPQAAGVTQSGGFAPSSLNLIENSSSSPDDSPTNHRASKRQVTNWSLHEQAQQDDVNTGISQYEDSDCNMTTNSHVAQETAAYSSFFDSLLPSNATTLSQPPCTPATASAHSNQQLQFVTPFSGVRGLFESPEGALFTTKDPPNQATTWSESLGSSITPQPYALSTSHLPGTGGSQYTSLHLPNLETPTPASNLSVNIPLASVSHDATPYQPTANPAPHSTMQSPVSPASVPITNSSGSQVNTIFSHAHSSNSYSSYSANPEPIPQSSSLDPVPELAEPQPAQDDLESESVSSHAKQHRKRWLVQEEQALITFWVGDKQPSQRLIIALSSPRSSKSGTLLAPEWTMLWKDVFGKSRELPPIVAHWWVLVDTCLEVFKLVSYTGEDVSSNNPFLSHYGQLDRLLSSAQAAKVVSSKLTVEAIQLWIEQGWYVRLRDAQVKEIYDRILQERFDAIQQESQSRVDFPAHAPSRPRALKAYTTRTSLSTESVPKSHFSISATPPPRGGMPTGFSVGGSARQSSQQSSQQQYQSAAGGMGAQRSVTGVAEAMRWSTSVETRERGLLGAKTNFLEAATKVDEGRALADLLENGLSILKGLCDIELKQLKETRASLMEMINNPMASQAARERAEKEWFETHSIRRTLQDYQPLLKEMARILNRAESSGKRPRTDPDY